MTLQAADLKHHYLDWLSTRETFTDIGSKQVPVIEIDTSFLDSENDDIVLYAYPQSEGTVRLTDDGWTLHNLASHGIIFDQRTVVRATTFNDILENYCIDQQGKQLVIETTLDAFPNARLRLLRGILKIYDLLDLPASNSSQSFTDDVQNIFNHHQLDYSANKAIVGPHGLTFAFDFIVPNHRHEHLIRTFAQPNRINNAKVFLWDADIVQHIAGNESADFIAIINDKTIHDNTMTTLLQQNAIQVLTYSQLEDNL